MGGKTKPSVKRISELTGFSPATVSNALNMKRGVNRETVEQIFQAAEQLGYATASKGLKSIKFVLYRKNGKIIDGSTFHSQVIDGVEQEARLNDLPTIFVRLNADSLDFEQQIRDLAIDLRCGIILLASEMTQDDFVPFSNFRVPLVLLDGWCDTMNFDGVLINNLESASAAVEYLIDRGHSKIGYLGGDFRIYSFQNRQNGFRMAMERHGLVCRPEWDIRVGAQMETAYEGMRRWLERGEELPTALFADNDLIALGAIKAMTEAGIRVPDDVSIMGFDDIPFAAISTPALTTVCVDKESMGREAVSQLITMAESPRNCRFKHQCCTTLIERESVRSLL